VETIKRQSGAVYGRLVVGQFVGAGLDTASRLYANSVCDMNSIAAAVVCSLWHYTSVIYAYNAFALKTHNKRA